MMYNMKIKKKNLLWPYGEFSDIKSSNRNPMDDSFWWAVGSIPILITPNIH